MIGSTFAACLSALATLRSTSTCELHEAAGQLKAIRCSEARKGLSLCFDPTNDVDYVADHFGRALLALGPLGMFRVLPLSGASAGAKADPLSALIFVRPIPTVNFVAVAIHQ